MVMPKLLNFRVKYRPCYQQWGNRIFETITGNGLDVLYTPVIKKEVDIGF